MPRSRRVSLLKLLLVPLLVCFVVSELRACSVSELLSMLQLRSRAKADGDRRLLLFVDESLARPMAELAKAYEARHPGVTVRREVSTTKEALRKVCDLGRRPDLLVVTDGKLAERWLVPAHAPTYVQFAKDEMVLAHTASSPRRTELGLWTWFEICKDPKVSFGMVDPMRDPAGYRSWMVARLSDRRYARGKGHVLSEALLAAARPENRRPSVMGLVRLLEAGRVDYALLYRSVAQSLGLPFYRLPEAVSLAVGTHSWSPSHYFAESLEVPGPSPHKPVKIHGGRVCYSTFLLNEAPHPDEARRFLRLLLGEEGHAILRRNGLDPVLWGAMVYRSLFGRDIGASPEDRARLAGYGLSLPPAAPTSGTAPGDGPTGPAASRPFALPTTAPPEDLAP